MISCTDFVPAYSKLFKFLERKKGKKKVIEFWNYLADAYLTNSLQKTVKKYGLKGCWIYWTKIMNEEANDFKMELDPEKEIFKITLYRCPSKGRFLKEKHIKPYRFYCEHCDVIYNRVLQPIGYEYILDMSKSDKAKCKFIVRKKKNVKNNTLKRS